MRATVDDMSSKKSDKDQGSVNLMSRKSNIHTYFAYLTPYLKGNTTFIISAVSILLAGLFLLSISHKVNDHEAGLVKSQEIYNKKIIQDMGIINNQLEQLAKHTTDTKQKALIQSIEDGISDLNKSINDVAKISDVQKVSGQLTDMKGDLENYMSDIKKTISTSVGDRKYLNPDILPFHVLSVDIISGQPYASIEYSDHISPIGVSDVIAGWKLVSADYDSGMAEFMNEKKQYVKVSLVE